jgi:hypothetical protein
MLVEFDQLLDAAVPMGESTVDAHGHAFLRAAKRIERLYSDELAYRLGVRAVLHRRLRPRSAAPTPIAAVAATAAATVPIVNAKVDLNAASFFSANTVPVAGAATSDGASTAKGFATTGGGSSPGAVALVGYTGTNTAANEVLLRTANIWRGGQFSAAGQNIRLIGVFAGRGQHDERGAGDALVGEAVYDFRALTMVGDEPRSTEQAELLRVVAERVSAERGAFSPLACNLVCVLLVAPTLA